MYLPWNASRQRIREAENARRNRLEIVKALADGQITRRDLFRWGIFTTAGMLAHKNGLSVFAPSAYGAVPTGTPRSPLYGATKFTQPMPRLKVAPRYHLQKQADGSAAWLGGNGQLLNELPAKNFSYHNDYNAAPNNPLYRNPVTGIGPIEGRPDGEYFAHQRWDELFPQYGFLLSIAQVKPNTKLIPSATAPAQNANAVWCFGQRTPGFVGNPLGSRIGDAVPTLVKLRYGEPCVTRIYNDLPVSRAENGGFGRNEISTHFHNAHNGAESDGACNAYHFPGTFYDYHWGTTMARQDMDPSTNPGLTAITGWLDKCSGPDDNNGKVQVAGDFREIQGSMWFHDHRFFFTAENVHKGMFALCNMYSAPDRGREDLDDGINLRLPSGKLLPWGNTDFDVNIAISNPAMTQDGQMFFDIFDTDGFLGDILLVNGSYYPYMNVLPRRYRLRTINASMSRFLKLGLVVDRSIRFARGTPVPFHFIANDGNFVVKPLKMTMLDEQGVAERYDIVVDFSSFRPGDTVYLVNFLQQTDGRMPAGAVSTAQALAGLAIDPAVGPIMQFKVVTSVQSVDDPTKTLRSTDTDLSADLNATVWTSGTKTLTSQIPIVTPVRTRTIEWGRVGGGDSRDPTTGECIPECGDIAAFPWSVRVDGGSAHTLNANRIGALIPKPGEVEHWTYINGGSSWDHPIHLHFEEGVTMDRGTAAIPATEKLVRKDVWRLRPGGRVRFQVRFGEFGGAYVNHCHNTVHEDFAMLLRYQLLTPPPSDVANYKGLPHWVPTRTPRPTPAGIVWDNPDPEILPEGDPRQGTTG